MTTIQIAVEIFPISEKLPETHKNVLVYCRRGITYEKDETFACWIGFIDDHGDWHVQDDECDVYDGERYSKLSPITEDHQVWTTKSGRKWKSVNDYDSAVAWAEIPLIPNYNLFRK